ncbi:hypothetical protein CsSME_00026589 [Camellia sinensis var. sinensis]
MDYPDDRMETWNVLFCSFILEVQFTIVYFEADQLASHRLFDVPVKAIGDIHIDDHHSNEDVALAIGAVTS